MCVKLSPRDLNLIFDWLSRHLVYFLCIDECGFMGQFNTMPVG